MSLRRRLFFFVFVPVTALYLAFALAGIYQTRGQLIEDVDDELRSDSVQEAALFGSLARQELDDLVSQNSGIASTRLRAIVDTRSSEVVLGTPPSRSGVELALPSRQSLQPPALVGSLGTPFNVAAEDGAVEYRAIATRIDGGRLVVLGEPLDRVDALIADLLIGTFLTGAMLLLAMAAVVWFAVRHGLRPLAAFVETTTRVARGDLSERVEVVQQDPAFAQIAAATNDMLDQIEISHEQQRIGRERLNDLVADAAHELRTPLTAMRGTIDMQKMGALNTEDRTRTAFVGMDEHTARMQHIVEELIVIARAENIRVDVQTRSTSIVDMGVLVAREVDAARRKQDERTISVQVDEPGLEVAGDEALLATALTHILQNALTHTPPQAAIHVHVEGTQSDILLHVTDDGPGIAPEIRNRVFERFVRADTSRSRDTGGAGLGLSIVKSVVESAGGKVELDSSVDRGCSVVVRLPRYERSGRASVEG